MNIGLPPCTCGQYAWISTSEMRYEETPEGMSCELQVFDCYACGCCAYYVWSEAGTAIAVSANPGNWYIGELIAYMNETMLRLWKENFKTLQLIRMILDRNDSPDFYISDAWTNPDGFNPAPIPENIPEGIRLMVRTISDKNKVSWLVLTEENLPRHKK